MEALRTDCDWMTLHIDALFEQDARGRLTGRRPPGGAVAPRFYLGRTRHGNLWRIRSDTHADVARRLSRYAGKERSLSVGAAIPSPPERVETIRAVLRDAAPIVREWRGPAFRFPRRDARRSSEWSGLAAGARKVEPCDANARALLAAGFTELSLTLALRQPCFAVFEDDAVRAVCYSACGQPGRAFEAGVETLDAQRGRGLAARCLAAWALAVEAEGAVPLYSTEWENRASRRLAEKLGLELYGEDLHLL